MAAKGRILIVGAGIVGLATAWRLHKRGYEVEIFEQGPIPNPLGSSWDEHRITRHAYGEFTGYAQLMPQAYALWGMLWKDLGAMHYEPTGATYFIREHTPWLEGTAHSLASMNISIRDLPMDKARHRYPMINLDAVTKVVETNGAGLLFPYRIMRGLTNLLGASGTRFHTRHQVTAIDAEHGTLVANGKTFSGDHIVVAAGAWADRLVPDLRPEALPSRQAVMFLLPPPKFTESWNDAAVMADLGEESSCYILPPHRGTRLKIGDHVFTRQGDADQDRTATDADVARLERVLPLVLRDFDQYQVLERKACYYTVTEDEHFIQRPIGPRGWLISACSGHGFKLSLLTGELAAEGITGERPAAEIAEIAAGRAAGHA
jgi:sarcosine oxidase/sarcosine oxidase subunit beta